MSRSVRRPCSPASTSTSRTPLVISIVLLAAAVVTAVLTAAPVLAHAQLVATDPASGQTVTAPLEVISLTYSEPIEETFSDVQVFDPSGQRVDAGTPTIAGSDTTVPMGAMEEPGTYTVVFRVIGADGHPVESRYTFLYEPVEVGPSPSPTASAAEAAASAIPTPAGGSETPSPAAAPTADVRPSTSPTEAAAEEVALLPDGPADSGRAIDPASIQLQDAGFGTDVGLLVARVLDYIAIVVLAAGLVGAAVINRGMPSDDPRQRTMRTVVRIGGVGLALAAATVFAFAVSSAAAEPLPQALSLPVAGRFAATRFGTVVLVQAVLGLLIAAVAGALRSRSGLWLVAGAAAVAAALPGLWGHAGTTSPVPLALASDWAHVVGAACWVGGLAVVLAFSLRQPVEQAVDPILRFSRLAGVAIWVVLASGVGSALLHVGTVEQLTDTGYGRLVIAKTALFIAIAALGYAHRRHAIPRLRRQVRDAVVGGAIPTVRRLAVAEVALMVVALGVAGGLASSVPAEAEAAARVEFVAVQLTDEATTNVTLDPARPGSNVVHVYVLGPDGRPRQVDGAELVLSRQGEQLPVDLIVSGPGHYTTLEQQIPDAGEYLVEVTVDLDGTTRRATGTVVVR